MPLWSSDGRELFFLGGPRRNRMMTVSVGADSRGLRLGKPQLLFEQSMGAGIGFGLRRYDVTPDGRHFVFATADEAAPTTEIRMVLDWRTEIDRSLAR